jgi:hypothetical protein
MPKKVTVADLVMGAGGLVTFLFSFFAFFKEGRFSASAWDGDAGAFATTVPAILGLVMLVWIGLQLAGVSLPEQVLTYNHAQLKGTWGIAAAGIMLSWISTDFDGPGKGVGFWFMLVGSLAMAVGAVMALLGKGSETIDIPGGSSDSESPAPPPAAPPAAPPSTPPPPPAT